MVVSTGRRGVGDKHRRGLGGWEAPCAAMPSARRKRQEAPRSCGYGERAGQSANEMLRREERRDKLLEETWDA